MSLFDHPEVETIFDEVVVITDLQLQAQLLAERCGDNLALRQRVESLLRAYTTSDFLENSVAEMGLLSSDLQPSLPIGQRVGDYVLLELLGTGGMAEVYLARGPFGLVAVKLLKEGMDTKRLHARFERERYLLQQMDHPGIAKFVEHGVTDFGRAYVVMELVRGLPITQYCRRAELSVNERLQLMALVCDAVEHAHSRGVIHRDLKPGNIMVEQCRGQPKVKIIDFGIAKTLWDDPVSDLAITRADQLMGTPPYMSPEQFAWSSDVTAESDVYSLGAILCEMLVGTTPLGRLLERQSDISENVDWDVHALAQIILRTEPLRPSQILEGFPTDQAHKIAELQGTNVFELLRWLRKDLNWIVRKAMRPERSDRYRSAAQLAQDLNALRLGCPTLARAPTPLDKIALWSRSHRGVLKNSAIVCLICVGVVATSWAIKHREHLRNESNVLVKQHQILNKELEQRQLTLLELTYIADMATASAAFHQHDLKTVRKLLDRYQPERDSASPNVAQPDLRRSEWHLLNSLSVSHPSMLLAKHDGPATEVRLSPDGRRAYSVGHDGRVLCFDSATGELFHEWRFDKRLDSLAISPDGRYLATGLDMVQGHNPLVILDLETGEEVTRLMTHNYVIESAEFSPDGKRIVSGERYHDLMIHEITGELITRETTNKRNESVAFSPDGRSIVGLMRKIGLPNGHYTHVVRSWSLEGAEQGTMDSQLDFEFSASPNAFSLSHDGQFLAVGCRHTLGIIQLPTGMNGDEATNSIEFEIPVRIRCLAWSPDGRHLAIGSEDGKILVWSCSKPVLMPCDIGDFKYAELTDFATHAIDTDHGRINGLSFVQSEPQPTLIAATENGSVMHWTLRDPNLGPLLPEVIAPHILDELPFLDRSLWGLHVFDLEADPRKSDKFYACTSGANLVLVDLHSNPENGAFVPIAKVDNDFIEAQIAVSPYQSILAVTTETGILVFDATTGELLRRLSPEKPNEICKDLVFQKDRLVALYDDHLCVYDVDTMDRQTILLGQDNSRSIHLVPHSPNVLVVTWRNLMLLDKDRLTEIDTALVPVDNNSPASCFSSDGKVFAVAKTSGFVELLNVHDGWNPFARFRAAPDTFDFCEFIDQDRTLFADWRFLDVQTGRVIAEFPKFELEKVRFYGSREKRGMLAYGLYQRLHGFTMQLE